MSTQDLTIDKTVTDPLAELIGAIGERAEDLADSELIALQKQCREEFARQLGLHIGREFSINQLKRGKRSGGGDDQVSVDRYDTTHYDHVEYLREPVSGKPMGFVTHSYAAPGSIEWAVERDGLNLEWIETSWYMPGVCTAALVTA